MAQSDLRLLSNYQVNGVPHLVVQTHDGCFLVCFSGWIDTISNVLRLQWFSV